MININTMKKIFGILFILWSTTINAQTKFGVLVHGMMDVNTKMNVAKDLGVSYVRYAVILQNWKGSDPNVDNITSRGFKIIMNVNWGLPQAQGMKSPVPFPRDMTQYKRILNDVLDKCKPELVVVENEELIKQYHTGPVEDYITELQTAVDVAHSKGLKVTNGGLTNKELTLLVYHDYLDRGMSHEANDFANRTMKPAWLTGPDADDLYNKAKKLIEAYKTLPLDYVNIHIYEPIKNMSGGTRNDVTSITPNAIKEIIEYVARATGKKVITNESGTRSNSPDLATQMLEEFAKENMEYVIWFSGDGAGGAIGLQNEDGSLRPNGVAFKKFVEEHKDNK
jgi:hypothetical protein